MLSFIGNREYALEKLVARQASRQITTDSLSRNPVGMGFGARPLQQFAQAQVIYTQPQFYSPLHTPQNWQIPTKRRETYQWLRYWYDNEPKVAAAIDFYSQFPVNGFETQCENSTVKMFFDHLNKKLNLDKWVKHISKEFYLLGDCFPFLEIDCESCHGSGIDRKGKPCEHKGATFSRLVVMNPDSIDVQSSVLADEPIVTLMADEQLRNIVWTKQPAKIYNRLPPHIRSLILAGKPIPLANESISHLKYNPHPYDTYGTSIVRRLFKMLTYKDKLMTAQWIIAERLILPIRIIKVGDAERPAGPVDIADVQAQVAQVSNDPNLTLVTHHAIDYDWIGASGKILQLSNEYELINKEMLQGLMLNDALLDGTMAGYQSAAIGAESMIQRMESWRTELARWIEEKIYKQVAMWKGFVDEEATKELAKIGIDEVVYIYPKIKWDDLNLRDDTQQKNLWMQLHERQAMSTRTLLEKFGLDYDQEVERMRFESAMQSFGGAGGAGGGGAPPGGGGGAAMPPPGGGGAPGGGMEMGGAPGGEAGAPPGGMDMGAGGMGAPPGGAPPGGTAAGMGGSSGKILSKGRKPPKQPEEAQVQPMIRLTSLEQKMYQILLGMRLPFIQKAQSQIGPYVVDFSIPALRIAIECDGDQWHSTPEAKAHDQKRDMDLAKVGWTTVRFSERELKEKDQAVRNTILELVYKLWRKAAEASEQKGTKQASLLSNSDCVAEVRLATGWLVSDLDSIMEDPGLKKLGQAGQSATETMDREIRASLPFHLEGETEVTGIVLPIVPDFGDEPSGPEGAVDGTADKGTGDKVAGEVRGEELVP